MKKMGFVAVVIALAVLQGCTWSLVTSDNKLWVQDKAERQAAFCDVTGSTSIAIPAAIAEKERTEGWSKLTPEEQNVILKANAAANNESWRLWADRIKLGWAAPQWVAAALAGGGDK